MKFLADECCDTGLVEALRANGHDVLSVMETLRGSLDVDILARAFDEDRVLITEDKDFGELVYRFQKPARGVLLLRFDVSERAEKVPALLELLEREVHRLHGAFVVLEVDKIRIRPL